MNLTLNLTTNCNMKCSFCGAWEYGKEDRFIPREQAFDVLRTAKSLGYGTTTLTGGEPTLHEQYCDILSEADKLGYWTTVTTNGLILTDEMIETYKKCKTNVRFSLHTLKEKQHCELTGTDTLTKVLGNMERLNSEGVQISVGATISDANMDEVEDLARITWEMGGSYIRYTPVVGVRRAKDVQLTLPFFEGLIKTIIDIALANKEKLRHSKKIDIDREQLFQFMVTRKCAGGSHGHIVCDCSGEILPCAFLPEELALASGSNGDFDRKFQTVYEKADYFLDETIGKNLKGLCKKCEFADTCVGGCFTTKISLGLSPDDEQPICILRMLYKVLNEYSESERKTVIDYWNSSFALKIGLEDSNRYCMRRLPIWEINYRYGTDRKRSTFNYQ